MALDAADWFGEEWKDDLPGAMPSGFDADGNVALTPVLRRWALQRMKGVLRGYAPIHEGTIRAAANLLRDDEITSCLVWKTSPEISPDSPRLGVWAINEEQALATMGDAVRRAAQQYDAQRFPTLDDWLRADAAGQLAYHGARGGGTVDERPHAGTCKGCGQAFLADDPRRVRCDQCAGGARTSGRRARGGGR